MYSCLLFYEVVLLIVIMIGFVEDTCDALPLNFHMVDETLPH